VDAAYGLAEDVPMIKSVVSAAVLSAGLVGYATAQEAASAAPAPNTQPTSPRHYYHPHFHYPRHYYHHHHHHYVPPGPASSAPPAAPATPQQ
jgi:hypothetical protein